MYHIENPLMNEHRKEETMAFTNTRGRYASFGVVTSLPTWTKEAMDFLNQSKEETDE